MLPIISRLRFFLVASLFSSAWTMSALAASGIVGYGITLFPDLCCQACYDSLSSLYLSCTDFDGSSSMDMDMGMDMTMGDMDMDMPMPMTSDECRASNIPWLQTIAYCIRTNCNAAGYAPDKQAECFSQRAVAGASQPALDASLPPTPPTVEVADDAMWLNSTSLVNAALYRSTYGTYQEFEREEILHSTYSLVIVFVVVGLCVVYGVWAQIGSTAPALLRPFQNSAIAAWARRHLILPAFLGSRRLEPLPGRIGYAPRRILGLFVLLYVVLNVVLSAVSFGSFQPNIYFLSQGFELCEYVGNRTGVLSFVNLSIAILFAGRNNLLIAWTGWSQTTFLILHRWAARIAALQAVVHSIVYTMAYFQPGYDGAAAYTAKTTEAFYQWGIVATITMCLGLGFAILPFRMRFYEVFLAVHIVMAVLCLVGCWYHIVPHFGYDYGYQVWLYLAFAFWAADRLARAGRVAFFNRLGRSTALVEAIPGTDVMQLTLFPRTLGACGPGQHTFLYFPGLGKPWESHPFTIAGWSARPPASVEAASPAAPADAASAKEPTPAVTSAASDDPATPSLRIFARPHAGVTAALRQRLLASAAGAPTQVSVYHEGPYAGHRARLRPLGTADTVLCLVGGIGITSALGFLQAYAEARARGGGGRRLGLMAKTTRFVLAWSAREAPLLHHVRTAYFADRDDVEYRLWCTGSAGSAVVASEGAPGTKGEAVTTGRMDIGAVMSAYLEVGVHTTVMCCGPGGMVDEAAKHVAQYSGQGFNVDLVEELYTW